MQIQLTICCQLRLQQTGFGSYAETLVNEAEDYEIAETGSIQFDETLKEKLKFCQISFFASEIDVEFEF